MPPRLRIRSLAQLADLHIQRTSTSICTRCQYATAAPVTSTSQIPTPPQFTRGASVQPPSHRDPAYRKSQLLRSYVSLLQTTPLIILFQHNNLKAVEWASIRRELAFSLQKIDEAQKALNPDYVGIADAIKFTVIRTNIFEPALRVAEYYKPGAAATESTSGSEGEADIEAQGVADEKLDPALTHALSRAAYLEAKKHHNESPLSPLLTGPIATLTFPTVSPIHVKAALSILSPQPPKFPAPTRRANPGYHEPAVQDGLKKLLMLGARIDGQIFDIEGTRWVGGIDGGIDGLRAQLVGMLQGFAGGLAQTLEGASRSLWFTIEGRRRMLEEEQNPKTEETVVEEKKKD